MPDRLPSLIVLVGFWIPPAVAGWVAAGSLQRSANRDRPTSTYAVIAALVLPGSAVACALAFRRRRRMHGAGGR